MKTQKAGCILINQNNKKIALVCRKNEYSFPKGHLEKGETILNCAIRETIEETGHNCKILCNNEIAKLEYTTPNGEEVECYFYLAVDEGVFEGKIDENDKEETVWIDINKVEDKLSYQNLKEMWSKIKEKEILKKALQ